MGKVVYNNCYGGFSLSNEGIEAYARHKGITLHKWVNPKYGAKSMFGTSYFDDFSRNHYFYDRDIERDDPALVAVVEELGDDAAGSCGKLAIVDLPTGTFYCIREYDGLEHIETNSDVDWKVAR